jgi:hypothetical protein
MSSVAFSETVNTKVSFHSGSLPLPACTGSTQVTVINRQVKEMHNVTRY